MHSELTWYRVNPHWWRPLVESIPGVISFDQHTITYAQVIYDGSTRTVTEHITTPTGTFYPTYPEARNAAVKAQQDRIKRCLEEIAEAQLAIAELSVP